MNVLGFFGGGKRFLMWVANEQKPQGKRASTMRADLVLRAMRWMFEAD